MSKRSWWLVAGTLALAACNPLNGLEACELTEDTQESFCYTRSEADRPQAPTQVIEVADHDANP